MKPYTPVGLANLKARFPDLTKERLYQLYVVEEKSLPDIHRLYGIDFKGTVQLMMHYGIERRTISQARTTKTFKTKIKDLLAPEGISNISQRESVKQKKRETFIAHYGVDNIWKTKAYYDWLDTFMIETYGRKRTGATLWTKEQHEQKTKKQWAALSPEEKESRVTEIIKRMHTGNNSRIEASVAPALDALHLDYRRHFYIGRFQYDYLIESLRLIIEVNGDFWHANPDEYEPQDIIPIPHTKGIKAADLWEKDARKRQLALDKGYHVLYLWESEMKKATNLSSLIFDKIQALQHATS